MATPSARDTSSAMANIIARQEIIADGIHKMETNIRKDSAHRKTAEYISKRLELLENYWKEFEDNHQRLLTIEDKSFDYFVTDAYKLTKQKYEKTLALLRDPKPYEDGGSQVLASGSQVKTGEQGGLSKTDELIGRQQTNFRAFSRVVRNIDVDILSEKWEIQDKLQALQARWNVIDEVHWQIDNLLIGSDVDYEQDFSKYEKIFESTKRKLNHKLNSTTHQFQAVPLIEIPSFSGNYTQWPTFMDLYTQAIHNNTLLTKGQKMQHLKGKLKGEAERIVQHLNISAENYDTCWEILTHRYNNLQLLFTKQMQLFMNQPTIQKSTSNELKRLHDTSLESIHAIHNLGVDTTTWDPILVHILTEKMDSDTYTSYMEYRKGPRDLPMFDELIAFLEAKFTALETVNKKNRPAVTKQEPTPGPSKEVWKSKSNNSNNYKWSLKTYHAYKNAQRVCPLCNMNHILLYCKQYQEMSADTKLKTIAQLNVCQNCMYCHNSKPCTSNKTCKMCNKAHHTSLHEIIESANRITKDSKLPTRTTQATIAKHVANHVSGNLDEVLLATIVLKVKASDGTYVQLRCLLDQGSQINLITEGAAQRLGLQRHKHGATISGIGISANKCKGTVQLLCESLYDDYSFSVEALVMTKMLNNLPNYTFDKQNWPHLCNINLADPNYNISRPVDILLDAGVYAQLLMNGILRGPSNAPIAQQTKVGWILLGNMKTFNCHAVLTNVEDISRFWELEEISDNTHAMTSEDEYCERLYATTTTRGVDGRYEVKIPMKENFEKLLGPSKPQAVAQFRQLEKRLAKDNTLSDAYKKFIQEYIELGHMKKCVTPQEPSCFLPHHGVIKPDSTTTKLRAVFNGSQKTKSGYSLNELMLCGPNLQQDIQSMILRWRGFQYVYTADIEKFYRQVRIQESDQQLQKIIWRASSSEPIDEYQLCTVTYGTKAAPYLAMRTVKQLIQDDHQQYPLAAASLSNQLYVDDLLGGNNNIEEAKETQTQLINMLSGAGFNLRKWSSNDDRLLQNLSHDQINQNMLDFTSAQTNKTLGITWNPHTDRFTFQTMNLDSSEQNNITKRSLLSDLSKLYDPLGWLGPITMKGKIIFQQVWSLPVGWDDVLPQDIQEQWNVFRSDLKAIYDINIPRWIGNRASQIELHGFCDASEKGYACAIYCKSTDNHGNPDIKLVAGKTKLAPLNKLITLPRLELCGALLLSRLMKKVIEALDGHAFTVYGWTDSTVVLGWLQGEVSRWKTFVANRVSKIIEVMPAPYWRHVNSQDNAADCASRGLLPSQLIQHRLWWEGPTWLKNDIQQPPTEKYEVTEEIKKSSQVCAVQMLAPIIEQSLCKHSSMTRLVRVHAWVSRFINNARGISSTFEPHLTAKELEATQNVIIKVIQHKHFTNEIAQLQSNGSIHKKSRILNLNPFLDGQGILRVGGRLRESSLSDSQKHPIILPHNDKLTELLINQAHRYTLHGGPRLTLSHLRDKFWILRGMKTVKGHVIKCVTCHRFKATVSNQVMADLPKPRVTPSRPFTHTGVDFTGQVEVKANKGRGVKTTKGYVAVFICLVTKAIHLELVSELSTASFLAALKRLCSRRGSPKHLYSDNGTNFVGAARVLQREHKEALQHYVNTEFMDELANTGIEWHFNAPSWPTAGGLWEAAVKSTKHHLRRVLGDQKLTYEEFSTLLTQVEACLNSRPLTALTDDMDDLDVLTPGHFLVGGPVLSSPLTTEDGPSNLPQRWLLIEKLLKDFWRKWSNEYLQALQTRGKWNTPTRNLQVGDMVLVKEDNIPPAQWLLGRVTDTHPGKDGYVRVVTLRTKNNVIKRPVTKLSRLPLQSSQKEPDEDNKPTSNVSTRPQRKKKTINSYFCFLLMMFSFCIAPSSQQLVDVTELNPTKLVYFDKLADMQVIQDQWKLIVYYNMTTYWRSLTSIRNYVNYLTTLCKGEPAYLSIASQFQHEINELQHYNDLLYTEHGSSSRSSRVKRAFVNAVGYLANTLFGVLDDRFAKQYESDIKVIQKNDNHLLNLYKNHTTIIEGVYNLLQRNEEVMNKQFNIIDKHLKETEERIRANHDNDMYITATALAANMIISNIRRVQQLLIDLVSDVRDGRIDIHLIRPDQFEEQLNIISGQLPHELTLPCDNTRYCVRELYKLARVHVALTSEFLIFEVKLPLINSDQYELNRVIPIARITENMIHEIVTSSEYLAVNLKRDMVIPLENKDITPCTSVKENKLLCVINLPVYNTRVAHTLCEAQIINNGNLSTCRMKESDCNNKWIKLHSRGAWLFSCCERCTTRIFCPDGVTSKQLSGTGIVTLGLGCMLKGDNFIIHSRNDYHSELKLNGEEPYEYIHESRINHVLTESNHTYFVPEDHKETFRALKTHIQQVKEQQDLLTVQSLTHETHYYVLYSVIGAIVVAIVLWTGYRIRRKYKCCRITSCSGTAGAETSGGPTTTPRHQELDVTSVMNEVIVTAASKVDKASPP